MLTVVCVPRPAQPKYIDRNERYVWDEEKSKYVLSVFVPRVPSYIYVQTTKPWRSKYGASGSEYKHVKYTPSDYTYCGGDGSGGLGGGDSSGGGGCGGC